MKPSTDLVMQALGDEDGFKIAEALIKSGPQTQSALAVSAEVSMQRTGEQLRLLRALGIVERDRAARGRWSVTNPPAVAAVFACAAQLATDSDQARARANEIDYAEWHKLAEGRTRGKAKPHPNATQTKDSDA
jgi:hypothetical protein